MKRSPVAVVLGVRTPFCKANGVFKHIKAKDLGAWALRELLARAPVKKEEVDEAIVGNVIQPPDDTNIGRIIAVLGGLPITCPAFTVNRNCASGMEAIVTGVNQILLDKSSIIVAGGAESMSYTPITFPESMRDFLWTLSKTKGIFAKIKQLFSFRPSMLKPQLPSIHDPICDLTMGQTAEVISRELGVTRKEQDDFAFLSQKRAAEALASGRFKEEIVPVPLPPDYQKFQENDDGIRPDQKREDLDKLRPVFEKLTGQVTAGNSSQVTDGAAFVLLMSEEEVKKRGIKPLGWITHTNAVAIEPSRMGLGPVYAISKMLEETGLKLEEIDLIEINEAFAAQIVALEKAFLSEDFAKKELGRDKPVGKLDRDKLNVNGGAVALGHPVGATGARIILTLLTELKIRGKKRGIATLCVGGGQGEAVLVEAAE
ncbi:MAG: thiolase family protein [Chlamydiia bacterium]|nr:thiolase family protein [Chlamydiia bacterium]